MRLFAALGCLVALWVSPGCFELSYPSCRITCTREVGCPRDLHCTDVGLCAAAENETCAGTPPVNDAGDDAPDASVADATETAGGPPQMLCHRQSCLTLADAVRSQLVLLLWPSALPDRGATVPLWPDLSGQGNDAHALNSAALPTVTADGVKLVADQPGAGFVIAHSASLDFGSGDFVVLVVSGLQNITPAVFFSKSDSNRVEPRQVALAWAALSNGTVRRPQARLNATTVNGESDVPQPAVNLYALRRTGGHVELRVNGVVLGSADLPTSTQTTSNAENVFVGVGSPYDVSVDSIEATIAIKGTVNSAELGELETYLRRAFPSAP